MRRTPIALPVEAIETAVLAALGATPGHLLDIGTGTGRLLELAAPLVRRGLGVDASRAMLALARSRLGQAGTRPLRRAPGRHVPAAAGGRRV